MKSNFVMTPKKYPQNFHTQKMFIFLKTQKNIEIQNFEPQKMDRTYGNIEPLLTMIEQLRVNYTVSLDPMSRSAISSVYTSLTILSILVITFSRWNNEGRPPDKGA